MDTAPQKNTNSNPELALERKIKRRGLGGVGNGCITRLGKRLVLPPARTGPYAKP